MSRTPAPEVAPPDLPGYRFIKNIGAGGNAQVYLYEQDLPRRKVAVKVLNESALSEVARRRFTAEANVTARLAHRHIVGVFEANVTPDGRPYLVLPYYPQPNLSVRARRSHFSVADVLRIGIQIGSAVETSHRSGVLHRDIKPQNILTDSYGEPVLTDFGIATTKGGDGPEGLSVPWSPPEILFGTAAGDERADVYSLGATLWHLLAGRSPFESAGDNGTLALMGRIQSDPPPRTQRSDVPESLERLLRQTLAKDPAARPQSALELIRKLQAVEQEMRLPLTQPVLPSDEPQSDTQGSDTFFRHRARAADDTSARTHTGLPARPEPSQPVPPAWRGDQPPWDAAPREETFTRDGLPAQPAWGTPSQSAWGAPPREDTATRSGLPPQPSPVSTGQSPWDAMPREQPATRGGSPSQPAWGSASQSPWDAAPRDDTLNRAGLPSQPAPGGAGQPRQGVVSREEAAVGGGLPSQLASPAWDTPGQPSWGAASREETLTRGGPPSQSAPGGAGQPSWGAVPRDDTVTRGGLSPQSAWGGASQSALASPAEADDDKVTFKRSPIRIDPRGPAAHAAGSPVSGAWGSAPAPGMTRERQFTGQVPESATTARPWGGANTFGLSDAGAFGQAGAATTAGGLQGTMAVGRHGMAAPGRRGTGRGRLLAFVGGGAALAVAVGVAVVALSHGGGQPSSEPTSAGHATQAGGAQNAVGPAAAAPGTPVLTTTRLSATRVTFRWHYDNAASGDTFPWSVSGTVPHKSGETATPELTLTVPAGQVACLEVRVRSAYGQASPDSQPTCWPQ